MHPLSTPTRLPRWGPRRWLRCSSLKYSRYSRSSRLAGGAPRPSRCDARLSPRAVDRRARQLANRPQRRLRRVEAETEVLVVVGREHISRLMPLRIPSAADVYAAFVLAQADGGYEILERTGVGVGHVAADCGRVVRRVPFVGDLERPRQLLARRGHRRAHLEFDVDVGFGALLLAYRAVGARHAVVEHHHVVLDHPEPLRFRVATRAWRVFFPLKPLPLRDVRAGCLRSGFLVVPQHESDRPLCPY